MSSGNQLFLIIICALIDLTQVICQRPSYAEQIGVVAPMDPGGNPAYQGQYPWSARVVALGGTDMYFGGVLIQPKWTLTAASRLQNVEMVRIWLGGVQAFDPHEEEKITMFSSRFYRHPDYENNTNDIALIRLPKAAPDYLKPIGLSQLNEISLGSQAVVVGYGKQDDVIQRELRSVPVKITAISDCLGPCLDDEESDVHLCTVGKDGLGPCGGDYGSPLIFQGRLIGLVSCFPITCEKGKPALYTRMSKFKTWVANTIKEAELNATL